MGEIIDILCDFCGTKNCLNDDGQALYCDGCGNEIRKEQSSRYNSDSNKYGLTNNQLKHEASIEKALNLISIKADYTTAYNIFYSLTEEYPEMLNSKVAWFGRILALTNEFNTSTWSIENEENLNYCINILNNIDEDFLSYYPELDEFHKKALKSIEKVISFENDLKSKIIDIQNDNSIDKCRNIIEKQRKNILKIQNIANLLRFWANIKYRYIIILFIINLIVSSENNNSLFDSVMPIFIFLIISLKLVGKLYNSKIHRVNNLINEQYKILNNLQESKSELMKQVNNQINSNRKTLVDISW